MRTPVEPAAPNSSLEHLAEQVERAAGLILRLKEQNGRLQELLREAERRSTALEAQLADRLDLDSIPEVQRLRKLESGWDAERQTIAQRIDSLVQKLEQLGP
jgi:chromosome segregation ATPase